MKSNVIFKSMSTEELKQHLSGLIWAQGELSTMSEFSGDESAAEYANEQAIDEIERILESREGEDLTDEKVGKRG